MVLVNKLYLLKYWNEDNDLYFFYLIFFCITLLFFFSVYSINIVFIKLLENYIKSFFISNILN